MSPFGNTNEKISTAIPKGVNKNSASQNGKSNTLSVYIDSYSYIDINYIKSKIDFVNYVLDAGSADIYILITNESTASGGSEYTLKFKGQKKSKGINFTLTFKSISTDTNKIIREKIVKMLINGIYPYIMGTSMAKNFTLKYNKTEEKKAVIDPWKKWMFTVSMGGYSSGQESTQNFSFHTSFNISKITKMNKFGLEVFVNEDISYYKYLDTTYESKNISKSLYIKYIKGVNDHISLGFFGGANNSLYSNLKLKTYLKAGMEYNIIPYSQFSKGEFAIQYGISPQYYQYYELTFYNKMKEMLYKESLSVSLELTKIWGNINFSVFGSNFLHDITKNQMGLMGSISLKVFKRLNFNFSGNYSFIHDQLSLPKEGATEEEVLLRKRELETSYNYFFYFGISYTFGSIYNNIVNTRF